MKGPYPYISNSRVTMLVTILLQNSLTDLYEILLAYLVDLRIGYYLFFIPLSDKSGPNLTIFCCSLYPLVIKRRELTFVSHSSMVIYVSMSLAFTKPPKIRHKVWFCKDLIIVQTGTLRCISYSKTTLFLDFTTKSEISSSGTYLFCSDRH